MRTFTIMIEVRDFDYSVLSCEPFDNDKYEYPEDQAFDTLVSFVGEDVPIAERKMGCLTDSWYTEDGQRATWFKSQTG